MACSNYDDRYENQLRGANLNGSRGRGLPPSQAIPDENDPLLLALTGARYEGTLGLVEASVDDPAISYSNGPSGTWITLESTSGAGSMVILNLPFDLADVPMGSYSGEGASIIGCSGLSTPNPWDASAPATTISIEEEPDDTFRLDFAVQLNDYSLVDGSVWGEQLR